MASYMPAIKGYIADVPRIWFKRCDGAIFNFTQLTQCSVNPQSNFQEVNAGWSLYPVAYLPGQGSMDIAATSGEFNADMFAMANATSFENVAEYEDYFTEHLTIDATEHTVKLARKAIENSIYINGLEQASEAGEGKYVVTDSSDTPAVTLITFDASETGEIEVSYRAMIADIPVAMIDNKTTAIGEAVCKWPVYDNGDDCSVSGIRGYVVLRMFKCRVTQLPGFDTSYKSPATNSVTFSAMDPERDDEKVYSVAFVPKAKMTL